MKTRCQGVLAESAKSARALRAELRWSRLQEMPGFYRDRAREVYTYNRQVVVPQFLVRNPVILSIDLSSGFQIIQEPEEQ